MMNATNLNGIGIGNDKEKSVVTDAQPKLISPMERLHVAHTRLCKTVQGGKNVHGGGFVQAADIGFGWLGPNNPLHFGS